MTCRLLANSRPVGAAGSSRRASESVNRALGRTAAPLGQGPAGAQGPFLARIGQQRRLRVVAGRPRYPGGIATPGEVAGPAAR